MHLGPFKLDRRIGQGGMATIWGGVHVELGTPVAFKFLRPDKDQARGAMRFLEETKALARMNHPGVVRIFDAGLCPDEVAGYLQTVEPESPYFVMEAVDGGILKLGLVDDWQRARWFALSLLDALAHAHARDVVHRDIKPANIMIDKFGVLKLADFGISRLTRTGNDKVHDMITGTPAYMSPEQIAGRDEREGPWTDLYAFGCMMHWLICGRTPFRGSVEEILSGHVHESPPPLTPRFDIPPELDAWVARLLNKDPQARFLRAADAGLALMKMRPPEARAVAVTDDLKFDSPFFPTLEVLDIEDSELGHGTSTISEGVEPPADWRVSATRSRSQLLSTGPGMLEHREPEFRAREHERDLLWEVLRECWSSDSGQRVGIVGSDGSGRRSLARWFGRRAHEVGAAHTLVFGDDAEYSARHQLKTWYGSIGETPGATAFYAARGDFDELAEWDVAQIRAVAKDDVIPGQVLSAVHARWTARLSADRVVFYYDPYGAALGLFDAGCNIAPARRLLVSVLDQSRPGYDSCITIAPLGLDEIREIVSDLIGLTAASLKELCDATDGNPGIAVDLARMAVREEALVQTEAGLELRDSGLAGLLDRADNRWPLILQRLAPLPRRGAALLAHADARAGFVEIEMLCDELDVSPAAFLGALQDSGILIVDDQGSHFAHPLARQAAIELQTLDDEDHGLIARTFGRPTATPRRRMISAHHAYMAGHISVDEVIQHARELRASSHVELAVQLLEKLILAEPGDDATARATVELAECHLIRQQYRAANELLERFDDEASDTVEALKLFLSLRRLEDVTVDQLSSIEPRSLSETACRMVSYMLMDLGEFEKARETLQAMDSAYDPPGRLFAYARLEFLSENWAKAEEWAIKAVDRFFETGRPDGAVAARDIVASGRLKQGRTDSAALIYRQNLKTARQIGFPTVVMEYNLATLLLETNQITDEIDVLLESVLRQAIERGRKDIEHCTRAAQINHAFAVDNDTLARHRIERLIDFDLGPWLQSDSLEHLEQAMKRAPRHLADELEPLVRHVAKSLQIKKAELS